MVAEKCTADKVGYLPPGIRPFSGAFGGGFGTKNIIALDRFRLEAVYGVGTDVPGYPDPNPGAQGWHAGRRRGSEIRIWPNREATRAR